MPVTAQDALNHVNSQNSRKRTPFPASLRSSLPPVFIYSLYDMAFTVNLGGLGRFVIPAKAADEEVSKPLKLDGLRPDEYDLADGAGRMAWNPVTGEDLAKAVIGLDSTTTGLDLLTTNKEWFGVFFTTNNPPKQKEIDTARKKLDQMMTLLLQHGDKLAASGQKGREMIGSQHVKAAMYLKQSREWSKAPVKMEDCPVCATPVYPGVAFCVTCKSVLDPVKWAKFQPANEKTPTNPTR